MKVSVEFLFHCRCDKCGAWWTIADRPPQGILFCPECMHENSIQGADIPSRESLDFVEQHKQEQLEAVL